MWLNFWQCIELKLNPVAAAGTEGFSKYDDICLGGQTTDGHGRHQRPDPPDPGLDPGAGDHQSGALRTHPRRVRPITYCTTWPR